MRVDVAKMDVKHHARCQDGRSRVQKEGGSVGEQNVVKSTDMITYLRTTLAVLPALVPQDCEATLLGGNALLLLEGGTEGTSGDLGVLVVPVGG